MHIQIYNKVSEAYIQFHVFCVLLEIEDKNVSDLVVEEFKVQCTLQALIEILVKKNKALVGGARAFRRVMKKNFNPKANIIPIHP